MQLNRSGVRWRPSRQSGGPRLRIAAVLIAGLSLLLAACGGGSDDKGSGGATSGSADEPITLTFWAARDFYMPPDKFKGFMEEHPNITVKVDVQDGDDILQQVSRMKSAGQKMPDIIDDDSFNFPAYYRAGLVQPLDQVMADWEKEDPATFKLLPDSAWEQGKVDGNVLGMGPWTTFDQLYVSTPWLKEAGVSYPFDSLDAIYNAAVAMKQARPDAYPLSVQALPGSGVNSLLMVLYAAGTEFDDQGIPDLTSEGGVYGIDWYKRMRDADLINPDAVSWGEDESRIAFLSGKAGLMIDSVRAGQDFVQSPDFAYPTDWDLTVLPKSRTGSEEDGVWTSAAQIYAITSDCDHPYEAGLLLRYIASTKNLVNAVTELGGLPPRQTEAINDPKVIKAYSYMSDEVRQALITSDARPSGTKSGEAEKILEDMFDHIIQGTDQSAQDLAEEYQKQLDALEG
jgi:ABC-type glycerol-3-phosphate transport system substrate-binding protein